MKFHGKSIIIISIMILGLLIILLLNGCFLFRQYGNIEGYVYVPESPTKGMPIILRDSSQVPAGYKPLVGATVGAVGFSVITTTDNDGYFILIDLPTGMIIVNIIPPSGSGYQSLTIPIQVVGNTTVDIGNYGSVSLPSENTDHWDVTINKIDTTNWPEVKVYVQVIDPVNNSPIIGATSNDFEVDISGNKIGSLTVTQFGGTSASPSSSSLVIDRSGSMSGTKLSDAKDAAKTFVGFMTANDRAEVVSFASSVTVDQSFTNDKSALYNAIDNLYAVGWTALYDGIWQGLDDTNLETNERKAVIVLTDGQENWSSSEHGGGGPPDNSLVIAHAQELNIPVYTIGIGLNKGVTVEEGVRISRSFDPVQDLQQIADDTGGEFFKAPTSSDLEYIYVQITQRVQQQYIITFADNNGITDGILTVRVNYNQISGEASKEYKPQEYKLDVVEVYGTQPSSTINVRESYGLSAKKIGEKYWGSTGIVVDGPQDADGYKWWKILWDNKENVSDTYKPQEAGWSVGDYLWEYDIDKRVRGVDVSANNIVSNWNEVYNSGRRFVFIKATEGKHTIDPKLKDNVIGASSAHLLVSVYHLGRPNLYPTNDDARSEADWFFNNAKDYLTSGYLRPVLDIESTTGDPKTLASWIHAWMEEVKSKANLTSYPILYCSTSYAKDLYDADHDIATKYPLWIADYSNGYEPTNYGWSDWAFRQYAGDINGVLGSAGRGRCPGFVTASWSGVDLDIYNGDINSLTNNFQIQ